ncbi:nucleolar protein 12-domain-containing protein [Zychaea mexicana]|uniref:nucleolar protein 12-domain-containing protein n=1 Tax=Zychaea mexicana TaxID=64656 RepID=UPI0022FEF86E|nr:nucleolar protein 12-domain-containing protein [Zychaea mexicana]KAI9489817.1 nucleolar protein 12-domain-containing protein [Zychaea mexicana]
MKKKRKRENCLTCFNKPAISAMPKAPNKKVKNTDILTAGSKAYAKKRKIKKERVERVDFDPESRKEYLTGFHKRKVERKKKAQENWQERLRQEKIRDRAALKAERKRQLEERLAHMQAALNGGLSDNEGGDQEETVFTDSEETKEESSKKEAEVKEFKSASALTTVTVIEDMDDWNNDD